MRRFIVLLAAVMPVALAIGLATVVAGPAPAALAASTCHNPGEWYDLYNSTNGTAQYWEAEGTGTGDLVVSVLLYTEGVDPTTWCQVAGSFSGYVLFREEGTSECATYGGSPGPGTPGGIGDVYLKPCDSSIEAQNWYYEDNFTLTTSYQLDSNYYNTCLSADKLSEVSTETNLIMVNSCSGDGGQSWYYTGASAP